MFAYWVLVTRIPLKLNPVSGSTSVAKGNLGNFKSCILFLKQIIRYEAYMKYAECHMIYPIETA